MRVAIIGYGRMGHEIEAILTGRDHEVIVRVDPVAADADETTLEAGMLSDADAAIEFSLPEGVRRNAEAYASAGCAAVVGTTGWDSERDAVERIVEGADIGYLVGSNFSIGANLFFALASQFASALNSFDEYDVSIQEIHHRKKQDSPSGTAMTVAERVLGALDRKNSVVTEALHRAIEPEELHVGSLRVGSVPGTHTVLADSTADSIELTHRARGRTGFAMGAVRAAEWLQGRTGLFGVSDFMQSVLSRSKTE